MPEDTTIGKRSVIERLFHLKEKGTNVRTEFIAGMTTFLAAIIVVVINPQILAFAGMDTRAVFWATALSAAIASIWMGLWGKAYMRRMNIPLMRMSFMLWALRFMCVTDY